MEWKPFFFYKTCIEVNFLSLNGVYVSTGSGDGLTYSMWHVNISHWNKAVMVTALPWHDSMDYLWPELFPREVIMFLISFLNTNPKRQIKNIINKDKNLTTYTMIADDRLTHFPWAKWLRFRRRYLWMHFHVWKVLYFGSKFTEVCS